MRRLLSHNGRRKFRSFRLHPRVYTRGSPELFSLYSLPVFAASKFERLSWRHSFSPPVWYFFRFYGIIYSISWSDRRIELKVLFFSASPIADYGKQIINIFIRWNRNRFFFVNGLCVRIAGTNSRRIRFWRLARVRICWATSTLGNLNRRDFCPAILTCRECRWTLAGTSVSSLPVRIAI